jgi:16S rRNA (guanine527-N7)-methyltransferase
VNDAASDSLPLALARHGIELPEPQAAMLARYCELLWQWNANLNLTRHTDYDKFVARDLVDTLAFSRHLGPGERVLDVGTGGGVPGLVLAILRDDLSLTLSESVGKKARAVDDMLKRLGMKTELFAGRAEELLKSRPFNSLAIRAVAPLPKLLWWFRPHWERFDRLVVLKGPAWVEERAEARHRGLLKQLALRKLESYPLPGTESESVLLQICPEDRLGEGDRCRLRKL